jgi:hypothetical protein
MVQPSTDIWDFITTALPAWAVAGLIVIGVVSTILYWLYVVFWIVRAAVMPHERDR